MYLDQRKNLLAARRPKDTLTQVSRNHLLIVLLAQESSCARVSTHRPGLTVNLFSTSGEDPQTGV